MGTSSIFTGNNDKKSLLPEDYVEQQNDKTQSVTWKTVKTDMSKYVTSGGKYGSARHVIQQDIRANGGTKKMVQQSRAGIRAGLNMGAFFSGVTNDGFEYTLQKLGIRYEGHSVRDTFSKVLYVIAPDTITKEDIVAREATVVALAELYDYVEENDMDIKSLDHMPKELFDKAMKTFFVEYIWAGVLKDLESRIEKYMADSSSACEREQELKEVVKAVVDVEYDKNGSIIDNPLREAVVLLSERCIGVLEGIV